MHPIISESWRARGARLAAWLLHPYLLFLLVALVVWWPDGFNIGPVNDGWVDLVTKSFLPVDFNTRTFSSFFFRALGMHIVSDGFQGWQAILFVPTVLRGVLMFEIIKRVFPCRGLFAIACGLIALLHPVDIAYFWLDSAGIGCAMVFALAAILCAIVHLQTGSRASLLCMALFQLASCFTYTAFLLVILAVPALVWLMQRLAGRAVPIFYLFKTSALICTFIVFQAVLTFNGVGHEAVVMDLSLGGVIAGYVHQAGAFLHSLAPFLTPFSSAYPAIALLPGVCAYAVAFSFPAGEAGEMPGEYRISVRSAGVLVAGLLVLAALSYLPYAVSNVRFGNQRQMLAAGIFLYMLLLLPVFFLVLPRLKSRHVGFAVVAFLAVSVTVTGLETRKIWVNVYRAEESLLAAVAATVPDPAPGSVIVVNLGSVTQAREIEAYTNRKGTFEQGLRVMYGDDSLQAGFTDFEQPPFLFSSTGLEVKAQRPVNKGLIASYGQLILLDYAGGHAHILDRAWLQQQAPKGTDLSAYEPGRYGSAPGKSAIICTMLEKGFRPGYCQ
jgi:hypothetical protein